MQINLRKMCNELYGLTENENCSSEAAEKSQSDEFEVSVRFIAAIKEVQELYICANLFAK